MECRHFTTPCICSITIFTSLVATQTSPPLPRPHAYVDIWVWDFPLQSLNFLTDSFRKWTLLLHSTMCTAYRGGQHQQCIIIHDGIWIGFPKYTVILYACVRITQQLSIFGCHQLDEIKIPSLVSPTYHHSSPFTAYSLPSLSLDHQYAFCSVMIPMGPWLVAEAPRKSVGPGFQPSRWSFSPCRHAEQCFQNHYRALATPACTELPTICILLPWQQGTVYLKLATDCGLLRMPSSCNLLHQWVSYHSWTSLVKLAIVNLVNQWVNSV